MNSSGALRRRLDPWAVMLLGVLIVLGVIILLSTPGPWHKVVPVTPRVTLGQPRPDDILVLVTKSADEPRCTAALWVHVRYERPAISVVVLPARLTGILPGAGMNSLGDIVAHAGPEAGAAAASEALRIDFDGWIAVNRAAVADVLPRAVPTSSGVSRRDDRRRSVLAWSDLGSLGWTLGVQRGDAERYASAWRPRFFNRAAFINFVLGSPDASTDMGLQAVSALAEAVAGTDREGIDVGVLPPVVYGNGPYERIRPAFDVALAYKVAFAAGKKIPDAHARVLRLPASDRVVVLSDASAAVGRRFVRKIEGSLEAYSRRDLRVVWVGCRDHGDIERALGERPDGRPPLAAVAAFGRSPAGPPAPFDSDDLLETASSVARRSCLPLVIAIDAAVAGPATADLESVAATSGFPYVSTGGESDGTAMPSAAPAGSGVPAPSGRRVADVAAADLAGDCFVRAVTPRFFAPRLRATRQGIDFYERGTFDVAVIGGADGARSGFARRLAAMGYRPKLVAAEETPSRFVPIVVCHAADRPAALCLAGDLGWSRVRVMIDQDAPAAIAVMMPAQ